MKDGITRERLSNGKLRYVTYHTTEHVAIRFGKCMSAITKDSALLDYTVERKGDKVLTYVYARRNGHDMFLTYTHYTKGSVYGIDSLTIKHNILGY